MHQLEKFEVSESCTLSASEIENIKEGIEWNIKRLNEGLEKGYDRYLNSFMQSYWSELSGMSSVCSKIGILGSKRETKSNTLCLWLSLECCFKNGI